MKRSKTKTTENRNNKRDFTENEEKTSRIMKREAKEK